MKQTNNVDAGHVSRQNCDWNVQNCLIIAGMLHVKTEFDLHFDSTEGMYEGLDWVE